MEAGTVVSLDTSMECIRIARKNIELNCLQKRVYAVFSPLERLNLGKQDVILANLTPAVLFRLLERLIYYLDMAGSLILSGHSIKARAEIVSRLADCGLRPIDFFEEQGWSSEIFVFGELQ